MYYKNNISGQVLTLEEFVMLVWDEAEEQFENNEGELWSNLTREEQISAYCVQYEQLVRNMGWNEVQERTVIL